MVVIASDMVFFFLTDYYRNILLTEVVVFLKTNEKKIPTLT